MSDNTDFDKYDRFDEFYEHVIDWMDNTMECPNCEARATYADMHLCSWSGTQFGCDVDGETYCCPECGFMWSD